MSARVGLDIGGTSIKAGRIGPAGNVEVDLDPVEIPRGVSPDGFVELVVAIARRLESRGALGIGIPGLLDRPFGGVRQSPNLPYLDGLPLRTRVAGALGLDERDVRVENDANAAALGEQWLGAGRGARDLLLLTLGTGVGGGLILGGELYAGDGQAGEIGHVVIDPDGPPCGCGSRGCLEQFASATAAKRRALARKLPAAAPGDLKLLAERARAGHAPERELLHEVGVDLGRGIGMVVCLLDLSCFVFGGGFSAALDVLEPGIRAGIRERSYGGRAMAVRLLQATLGPSAGWIGAARLAHAAPPA
ncbi:MAG: ROK family protein [Planctomycetota bacterium]|nr:MAG: ROK family protein [Planctomycetota bacterium]